MTAMNNTMPNPSNLTKKFEFLQDRAQRKPIREGAMPIATTDATKKANISHLKDFYLKRLANNEPGGGPGAGGRTSAMNQTAPGGFQQPQATGQRITRPSRPTFSADGAKNAEEFEIMCSDCFIFFPASQAHLHKCTPSEGAQGQIGLLDAKLHKLRAALEVRLNDAAVKVNVMRHLTQLRYHVDHAVQWTMGCSEIGALSDHTVQQVKQLTSTARHLAPAVYIFSKRIENVIVQKDRELRKAMVNTSPGKSAGVSGISGIDIERDMDKESVADVNSIVSELDSDCGTQYAETQVTQDGPGNSTNDVADVSAVNEYLTLKNEDEQRRWFYSQCLTIKLSCTDKTRARKMLISDMYSQVRQDNVPIEKWVDWIKGQLTVSDSKDDAGDAAPTPAGAKPDGLASTTPISTGVSTLNSGTTPAAGGAGGDNSSFLYHNYPTRNATGGAGTLGQSTGGYPFQTAASRTAQPQVQGGLRYPGQTTYGGRYGG